ncbi:MAG: CSLREA domain-containing protein [Myxococcota bacterium]
MTIISSCLLGMIACHVDGPAHGESQAVAAPAVDHYQSALTSASHCFAGPGATIAVTTHDDELNSDGDCSLREAVVAANSDSAVDACAAGAGSDTIVLAAGDYPLTIIGTGDSDGTLGDLDITDGLTIAGVDASVTTVRGHSSDNVFQVATGTPVCFDRVTLSGGYRGLASSGGTVIVRRSVVADNHGSWAGGILNNHGGTMTIEDSVVENNSADYGAGILNGSGSGVSHLIIHRSTLRDNHSRDWGGGLMSTGIVFVVDSAAYGNHAVVGGGLFNDNSGSVMSVVRTTVSDNHALYGGGLFNDSTGNPTLLINAATITGNSAGSGGGGGVYARGTVRMTRTILADNQVSGGPGPDCALTINSDDYNLVGTTSGCTFAGAGPGDQLGAAPALGPLGDHGGATVTHSLLPGSPAIDAIPDGVTDCRAGVSSDQRGARRAGGARLGGPGCDIGAVAAASNGTCGAGRGTVIPVDTTDDEVNSDGDCSLREAVLAANLDSAVDGCPAGSGADEIALPAGDFQLTIAGTSDLDGSLGDLDLSAPVTISGAHAEATRIIGMPSDNVFQTVHGASVCLSDLTMTGGVRGLYNPGGAVTIRRGIVSGNHGGWAGGLLNNHAGTMTIEDSVVENNSAGYGAGILNGSGSGVSYLVLNRTTVRGNHSGDWGGGLMSTGIVYVVDSAFYDNHAIVGGGLFNDNYGSIMTVVRTTVSGNDAVYGGGLFNDSTGTPTLIVEDSTVTGNTAGSGGGGLYARGNVYLAGSIIWGNSAISGPDCKLTVVSNDYNMLGSTAACTLTGALGNTTIGVDPLLDILSDNGGPTLTHALRPGSPAIDAMPLGVSGCRAGLSGDQRGVRRAGGTRLGDAGCDIGAFEAASHQ